MPAPRPVTAAQVVEKSAELRRRHTSPQGPERHEPRRSPAIELDDMPELLPRDGFMPIPQKCVECGYLARTYTAEEGPIHFWCHHKRWPLYERLWAERRFGQKVAADLFGDAPKTETAGQEPEKKTEPERPKLWSTRKWRSLDWRHTAFVSFAEGLGITDAGDRFKVSKRSSLAKFIEALPLDVARVYLVGARPGKAGAAGFREWAFGELPFGWEHGRHFLDGDRSPVLRYRTVASRRLEVHQAATWFGDGSYTVAEAQRALAAVRAAVAGAFGEGASVLSTPGSTGRELWLRTIPSGDGWPVLSDEAQELIRSTSGQGRITRDAELSAAAELRPELPGLAELDGRLMYGALCWELGGGGVIHDHESWVDPYARGRYRVRFCVPRDWDHVGLLPVADEAGGWVYPDQAGEVAETWCDGAELRLAVDRGWRVEVLERLLLVDRKADPLGAWAKKLVAAREGADDPLAQFALRSILLHGIGAFHGRPRTVTRVGASPPRGVRDVWVAGDGLYTWQESEPAALPELAHPEWSSAVWARCRVRLLEAPTGKRDVKAGALYVPRSSVVAFRTDALYLDHDPRWPDDGRVGRLRLKNWTAGPLPHPSSTAELLSIRAKERAA